MILDEFLQYYKTVKGKSENTIINYGSDLRHCLQYLLQQKKFPSKKIEDVDIEKYVTQKFLESINYEDLVSYVSYLEQNGNSNSTRSRKISALKAFYEYLTKKRKVLLYNVADELDQPKIGKRLPVCMSFDEAKKLLSSIGGEFKERDYCIITLFLNCGLRLSELASIEIDKISKSGMTVIGKGNKERPVKINDACIRAINNYLTVRQDVPGEKKLFLSKRNQPMCKSTIQDMVKKNFENAGLDFEKYHTHTLRHTAISLMYQAGVGLKELQELAGHESIATTQGQSGKARLKPI
jgi:site-specific recombinase XerD